MRPPLWHPPIALSNAEQAVVQRIRRAKLFVFLRTIRHHLFDDAFQDELAQIFRDSARGQPPVPPAPLVLATILQAYTGASDDEVIEVLTMDRCWQLALDCLDCETAPFGKATLVRFRAALISHGLDRRLIERSVELAEQTGGVGPRAVRAALDSSPLWGAARVEDTYNLLGHALRKAVGVIARQQGRELADIAVDAGAGILGQSSLKAALDRDWDDPAAREQALAVVVSALETVETWLATQPAGSDAQPVGESMTVARQVHTQDVEVAADGPVRLRRRVASDRRISSEDGEMRHGRKSRSLRVDGYKRHVLRDLDTALVRAVGVTAANAAEATVTAAIVMDLAPQGVTLTELHIDRAYLSSTLVRERPTGLTVYCKAWQVTNGTHYAKTAFTLDWERQTIRCPTAVTLPFVPADTIRFPTATCASCPLRERCTSSPRGRSVTTHPDERLLADLRARQPTPAGRAKLRERVAVEHTLAHVAHWQGRRTRYIGQRKNLFDLRRAAVVHNLHVLARQTDAQPQAAA